MQTIIRTIRQKLLPATSVMLALSMLFTVYSPSFTVRAVGIDFPVFDKVTLTDTTLNKSIEITDPDTAQALGDAANLIGKTDGVKITYHFSIPNHTDYRTVFTGDTYHFSIPSQFGPITPVSGYALKDSDGVVIATVNLTAAGAGTLTITPDGAAKSDITGEFVYNTTFAGNSISNAAVVPISFTVDGLAQPFTVNVSFSQPAPDNLKTATYDPRNGKIAWKVDLNRKGNTIPAGSSISDIITGYQTYDAGTFVITDADSGNSVIYNSADDGDAHYSAGAPPTSLTAQTGTLNYTFGAAFTHHYVATYTTTVTDPSKYFDTNSPVKKIGNTMTFTHAGWSAQPISVSPFTIARPNYLAKNGAYAAGRFNWTITFNNGISPTNTQPMNLHGVIITDPIPNGLVLDKSSIVLNGTGGPLTEDLTPITENVPYGLAAIPHQGMYILSGSTLIYNAGDITTKQSLALSTTPANDYTQQNSSYFTFVNTASLFAGDNAYLAAGNVTANSPSIGTSIDVISKSWPNAQAGSSYNTTTHEMQWTVTVNNSGSTLPAGTVVKDVIPAGLQYKSGTLQIDGNPPAGSAFTGPDASGVFTYTFGDSFQQTYHITYTTVVTDPNVFANNASKPYVNPVTLYPGGSDTLKSEASATQTAASTVLEKAVSYDYVNRQLNWTITVNKDRTALSGVHVRDYLTGMNMSHFTLDPSSVKVNGSAITDLTSPYSFTYTGGADGGTGAGGLLDVNLGNISDRLVITFSTKLNHTLTDNAETFFADNLAKSITNSATLTDTDSGYPSVTVSIPTYTINNNLLTKQGTSAQDYVDWTVQINQNALHLQNVALSDTLPEGFTLDTQSVKLYQQTLTSDGTYLNPTQVAATNYSITYNATTRQFNFTMPADFNTPYQLTFRTYATAVPYTGTPVNRISFAGEGVTATSNDASSTVSYGGVTGSASGTTGSISVWKKDPSAADGHQNLAGATFVLNDGFALRTAATAADGKTLFSLLRFGTYTITETIAPANYQLDPTPQSVTISSGSANVTRAYANQLKTGAIEFTKLGDGGSTLAGAGFTLSGTQFNGAAYSGQTAVSGANGIVRFTGVPYGTYTITESSPPDGYSAITLSGIQLLDTNGSITNSGDAGTGNLLNLDTGTTDGTHTLPASARTDAQVGNLTVTKTDADTGVSVAGAAFRLTLQGSPSTFYTPDSASGGTYVFRGIPLGTYTLTETAAPADYLPATAAQGNGRTVVFSAGGLSQRVLTASVQESKQAGQITFTKTDGASPLAGAQFGLFYDRAATTPVKEVGRPDRAVVSAVTGSNGVVTFTNVPFGDNYWVAETAVPENYDAAAPFQVSLHQASLTLPPAVNPVVNTLKTGTVRFTKTDGFHALAGASFTLSGNGVAPQTATSGADGLVSFTGLPYSDTPYTITETSSPNASVYRKAAPFTVLLNDAVEHNPNSANTAFTHAAFTAANGSDPNTLTVDDVVDTPVGSIVVTKVDARQTDLALAGAGFRVFDSYTGTYYTPVSATDASGNLTFSNLPLDPNPNNPTRFTVSETAAPRNYELSSSTLTITLYNRDGLRDSVADNLFGDARKVAAVLVHKQDQDGKALAGAKFTLYETVGGTARMVSAPGLTGTVTSDGSGLVRFENVPYGEYFIRETGAPADYTPDTRKITVSLSDSDERSGANPDGTILTDARGTHTLDLGTVINTVKKGGIRFIKLGESGPLGGAVFTLYNAAGTAAVKTPDGGLYTAVSDSSTGAVVFTGVPYGDYTVVETGVPAQYKAAAPVKAMLHDSNPAMTDGVVSLGTVQNERIRSAITVHITDPHGQPVPGKNLQLIDENGVPLGAAVWTDSNGNATFSGVPNGQYRIVNLSDPGLSLITITLDGSVPLASLNIMTGNPKTQGVDSVLTFALTALLAGAALTLLKIKRAKGKN